MRLDARAAILAGGESGPAVVPGDAGASLLIDAINYGEDHQMPPKSKLPAPEIATLTRWVEMGAPWGRRAARAAGTVDAARRRISRPILRERARHWSFQPLRRVTPTPVSEAAGWMRNPIDRFILAGLSRAGL